ncbi:transmembrane protein 115 [Diachasma alloeum]|uniref:transmembrane protein 115 n=1 Tax=Diachasma alloeum TaxID=454923 RepID=UPI0007381BCB|nr:transmembrane protein 115 [Diachasma alloeum]XP_015116222.1 transmembrane protein 115 [Diachasma alloeum]
MAFMTGLGHNIPYLRQQFVALLGNTSASVKVICIIVLLSYCLSYIDQAVLTLSVTPGYLLPSVFWIWTALTFCFLEIHFWEVCADIITVGLCGKLIEPLWGAMEMMTFFAIVNIGVAILSAMFYLFLFMCTDDPSFLFEIHIHGLTGYIAGVSVAVKQIMPDHILAKTPVGKITNRNVPLTVWILLLLLWIVGLLEGTQPTMFLSGLFVSWTYLRFYQKHSNGTKGDMTDNFTFASFFPNVLQPPVAIVSNTLHNLFVRIGLCKKVVRRFDMSNAPPGLVISLPGIDPQDSERRRQIALKALSERLSKDHARPWQQDKHKKHSSTSAVVSVSIPESALPKPVPSPLIPQLNLNIQNQTFGNM